MYARTLGTPWGRAEVFCLSFFPSYCIFADLEVITFTYLFSTFKHGLRHQMRFSWKQVTIRTDADLGLGHVTVEWELLGSMFGCRQSVMIKNVILISSWLDCCVSQ